MLWFYGGLNGECGVVNVIEGAGLWFYDEPAMIDENVMRNRGEGLSREEVETILRGMRAVFGEAGRTSLAKLLAVA